MKRRSFIQGALLPPTATALLGHQASGPPEKAPGPAKQEPHSVPELPKIEATLVDDTAEMVPLFFSTEQFATLNKLSTVLMPPMKEFPGADNAGAPEFLDFLLGASLPDRQNFYRSGLDELQSRAKKEFNKPFADLDASQADAILRPLLVPVPWPDDPPRDLGQHFLSVAHQDIRTATMNSREWNLAAAASASRSHDGGVGEYWYPIEPLYSIQPPSVK